MNGTTTRWVVTGASCAIALLAIGCSGASDPGRLQIQFYSPPGAQVIVGGCQTHTGEVAMYDAEGTRLERTPDEYCIVNLRPGTYPFKYTAAEGLSGLNIYGELEVHCVCCSYAQMFRRLAFVPISLPSSHFQKVSHAGDEIFPYRGERVRTAIDETDLMRLKQGDVVEKVFVVADLKKAEKVVASTRKELILLDRELEYADARFKDTYSGFRLATDDPVARFWGADREYISWEKKRLELQHKIDKARAKLKRAEALLKGDRVLIRRGMLVLATEEVIKPYRDMSAAADELGEILLVMRLGGRHMQWGDPAQELASAQP